MSTTTPQTSFNEIWNNEDETKHGKILGNYTKKKNNQQQQQQRRVVFHNNDSRQDEAAALEKKKVITTTTTMEEKNNNNTSTMIDDEQTSYYRNLSKSISNDVEGRTTNRRNKTNERESSRRLRKLSQRAGAAASLYNNNQNSSMSKPEVTATSSLLSSNDDGELSDEEELEHSYKNSVHVYLSIKTNPNTTNAKSNIDNNTHNNSSRSSEFYEELASQHTKEPTTETTMAVQHEIKPELYLTLDYEKIAARENEMRKLAQKLNLSSTNWSGSTFYLAIHGATASTSASNNSANSNRNISEKKKMKKKRYEINLQCSKGLYHALLHLKESIYNYYNFSSSKTNDLSLLETLFTNSPCIGNCQVEDYPSFLIPKKSNGQDVCLILEFLRIIHSPQQLIFEHAEGLQKFFVWAEYHSHRMNLLQSLYNKLTLTLDPNHYYVIRNDKLQKLIEHIGVKNYRLMAGETSVSEFPDTGALSGLKLNEFFAHSLCGSGIRSDFLNLIHQSMTSIRGQFYEYDIRVSSKDGSVGNSFHQPPPHFKMNALATPQSTSRVLKVPATPQSSSRANTSVAISPQSSSRANTSVAISPQSSSRVTSENNNYYKNPYILDGGKQEWNIVSCWVLVMRGISSGTGNTQNHLNENQQNLVDNFVDVDDDTVMSTLSGTWRNHDGTRRWLVDDEDNALVNEFNNMFSGGLFDTIWGGGGNDPNKKEYYKKNRHLNLDEENSRWLRSCLNLFNTERMTKHPLMYACTPERRRRQRNDDNNTTYSSYSYCTEMYHDDDDNSTYYTNNNNDDHDDNDDDYTHFSKDRTTGDDSTLTFSAAAGSSSSLGYSSLKALKKQEKMKNNNNSTSYMHVLMEEDFVEEEGIEVELNNSNYHRSHF